MAKAPDKIRVYKTWRFKSSIAVDRWLNAHREWVPISVYWRGTDDFIYALCVQEVKVTYVPSED